MNTHQLGQRFTSIVAQPQARFFLSDGTALSWHDEEIKPCGCCPDCNEIISMQEQEIDNLRREIKQLNERLKVRI